MPDLDEVPYNKISNIACHNCYEPQYASNIADVFQNTKSIELDIWDNEIASRILGAIFGNKLDRDWYVKHDPQHRGNLNCFGGTFKQCLINIKNWAEVNPLHNVITVFIDKKENWSDVDELRKPSDFDQLIKSIFSPDQIFSPSTLLQNSENLKTAALSNFPAMKELNGKFIFVITDGTLFTTDRKPLAEYLESQKSNAVCFVAPEISTEEEITQPVGLTIENSKNIVFYNLKYPTNNLTEKIESINCLSRVYDSSETIDAYNELVSKKVNFIALYNFKLLS